MKHSLLIMTALVIHSAPTLAADAAYEEPIPATVYTPSFSWTGFTAGIQTGYSWNNFDLSNIVTVELSPDGWLLGGFVGYNHQLENNWVLGVEGDLEANFGDDRLDVGGITVLSGLEWQGSIRARIGYAFDRALLYGTAGWAISRSHWENVGAPELKGTLNGYTIGAGIDYAITDTIYTRIEYRYTDFGDKLYGGTVTNDLDQHAIRVGLGLKF